MRLKEARLCAGLTQKQATARLAKGFDGTMLSRCESGIVVPPPETLRRLAERYGVRVRELYSPAELDYGLHGPKTAVSSQGGKEHYKLTVRLENGLANDLQTALEILEIASVSEWVRKYAKRTIRRAKKKAAACGANTDSGKEDAYTKHYL